MLLAVLSCVNSAPKEKYKPKFKIGDCIVIDEHFEGMISDFYSNGKDYGFMFGLDVAYCDSVDRLNDGGGRGCSVSNYDIEYVDKHATLRKCRTNDETGQ